MTGPAEDDDADPTALIGHRVPQSFPINQVAISIEILDLGRFPPDPRLYMYRSGNCCIVLRFPHRYTPNLGFSYSQKSLNLKWASNSAGFLLANQ